MDFEILVDKAFEIVIGFLLGILIITLYRRADRFVHAQIENLHDYVRRTRRRRRTTQAS
jgi:hypothetical protein